MWFKNLRLYRFTEKLDLTEQQLNDALAAHAFQPCGKIDPMRYGWTLPLGRHGSEYLHVANGYTMICAKRQEKILPAGVVKEHLEEHVLKIQQEEGRTISRKERDGLKDEIIFELLPKAFTKSSLDFAYIASKEKMLVINASSAKKAENLIAALREAVGTLKLVPITPESVPTQVMTLALQNGDFGENFQLGEDCELRAPKDDRVISCKKQDLNADEILNHVNCGMVVTKLSAIWKDAIQFTVDDQFAIKRLKFEDSIQDKVNERNPESVVEEFDLDFSIMTMELSSFIQDLIKLFGLSKIESV